VSTSKPLVRKRRPWDLGTWVWLGNRIAGTAIILYLIAHIFVISIAKSGAESFDGVMEAMHNPIPLILEILLVIAVTAHGLNGLRHIIIDFGICCPKHHIALSGVVAAICVVVFIVTLVIYSPVISGI